MTILSAFFKKLLAVAFSRHENVNDTSPSEISNDELVTAYEWVVNGHLLGAPVASEGVRHVFRVPLPAEVGATLRKLGAA